MEAAARGASEAGGTTVGILPGPDADDANPYILIPIATDLGHARNAVNVRAADAVIAVAGGYGTLSEIALALAMGVPVVSLADGPAAVPDVVSARCAEDAVATAFALAGGRGR
jgi:uncharacterized protein (TIGR00725 family)